MLQRQEEPQTKTPELPPRTTSQAGTQRVTPDELTEALSVLEARREEESKRVQNTLSIDEAVRELGLNLTPEEVWQQVEAQRAEKARQETRTDEAKQQAHSEPPPSPPGPALADTARETARVMAEQAQKLAVQASAVAQAHLAASAAQGQARQAAYERHAAWRERMTYPRRRGGWGAKIAVLGLLLFGLSWYSHGHGVTVNGNGQTQAYVGAHNVGIVNGNQDALVFRGDCGTLILNGSHDTITVEGHVKTVIANGNDDTVLWSNSANASPPTIIDNGDGNHVTPISQAAP